LFQGPLAQKIEEAQKSTCKANKNKSGGNFSHAASQKKSSVTRQIVSLPKNTQGKRKKKGKNRSVVTTPSTPHPNHFLLVLTCGAWRIPSQKAKEGNGWREFGHKTTAALPGLQWWR